MKLIMVPHEHHAAAVQRFAQLVKRMLYRRSIAVGRLLQLAEGESTIGAEENRFDRRRQVAQSCLGSMWIGPKRSCCGTVLTQGARCYTTATNVSTASRRSSDSRSSSGSAVG